jgi:SAM-dependent methyltransferase
MVRYRTKMLASSYDDIAAMYHKLWVNSYLPAALPALERLFFCQLKQPARVLDVCCGSGHVTLELVKRGYRVTGIDSSAALIDIAKQQLPSAELFVQDVRHLAVDGPYEAALSTFDSLNHILSLEDLHAVFSGVYSALGAGGLFVFDMNLEEAYSLDLHQWSVNIGHNAVGLSRGLYDPITHTAHTELVWFTQNGSQDCWQRRQSVVEERCYEKTDILQALQFSGFRAIEAHAAVDICSDKDFGHGRYFFSARR